MINTIRVPQDLGYDLTGFPVDVNKMVKLNMTSGVSNTTR